MTVLEKLKSLSTLISGTTLELVRSLVPSGGTTISLLVPSTTIDANVNINTMEVNAINNELVLDITNDTLSVEFIEVDKTINTELEVLDVNKAY